MHCHPLPDSYSAALSEAAHRGLQKANHEVRLRRLYRYSHSKAEECYQGRDFSPALTNDERKEYMRIDAIKTRQDPEKLKAFKSCSQDIKDAIADLRWCDSLVRTL